MANSVNVVAINNPYVYQGYDEKDINLISNYLTNQTFGDEQDDIELFVYDLNDNLVFTDYEAIQYYSDQINPQTDKFSNVILNPEQDLLNVGINRGSFNVNYKFYKNVLRSSFIQRYWISEISPDRTELRLKSQFLNDVQLIQAFQEFDQFRNSIGYYSDFVLNFGDNKTIIGVNVAYSEDQNGNGSILIKLYKPLPVEFEEKDTLWIAYTLSEPVSYNVTFLIDQQVSQDYPYTLRGPNFTIDEKQEVGQITKFYDFETLFSSDNTAGYYNQLKSIYEEKGVEINVDYTSFENFIHFSSAVQRILNFKYKVQLIESYSADIAALDTITNNELYVNTNKASLQASINNIIEKFDGYEYYLYFESGSTAWPKYESQKPYSLYSVSSSQAQNWLGSIETRPNGTTTSILFLANEYDINNQDLFLNSIPEYLREDQNNLPYELFLDMVGQHFDNIWGYYKDVTQRYNANNNLNKGISKELVANALKALGIKLYTNTNINNDLYYSLLGYNEDGTLLPQTGNEQIDFYISSSIQGMSFEDITLENYKKIYHNIPYLLKTKGTERGLRALINCFGIPDTILKIKEFGGYTKSDNKTYFADRAFSLAYKNSYTEYIKFPWAPSYYQFLKTGNANIVPDTITFRFKSAGIPESSDKYKQGLFTLINNEGGDYSFPSLALTVEYNPTLSPINSKYEKYGNIVMTMFSFTNLPIQTDPIFLPVFDSDKWWTVMIRKRIGEVAGNNSFINNSYDLIIKCADLNEEGIPTILFQETRTININGQTQAEYNEYWNLFNPAEIWSFDAYLGGVNTNGYITPDDCNFNGWFQEFRYWAYPLEESAFDNHVRNSLSYSGNSINDSQYYLIFRAPLGNNLIVPSRDKHYVEKGNPDYDLYLLGLTDISQCCVLNSFHPSATGSFYLTGYDQPFDKISSFINGTDPYSYGLFSDNNNKLFEAQEITNLINIPSTGINQKINNKVIVEDNLITSDNNFNIKLSPTVNIQSFNNDRILSSNDVEVGFSITDPLDDDIINQLGYFKIDDFIGKPSDQYEKNYKDLKQLRRQFYRKFTNQLNAGDLIRGVRYLDNSLFKMIKDFVPAKASLSSAIIIKPSILDRSKYERIDPEMTISEMQAEINIGSATGSHGFEIPLDIFYSQSIITPEGEIIVNRNNNRELFSGEWPGTTITVIDPVMEQTERSFNRQVVPNFTLRSTQTYIGEVQYVVSGSPTTNAPPPYIYTPSLYFYDDFEGVSIIQSGVEGTIDNWGLLSSTNYLNSVYLSGINPPYSNISINDTFDTGSGRFDTGSLEDTWSDITGSLPEYTGSPSPNARRSIYMEINSEDSTNNAGEEVSLNLKFNQSNLPIYRTSIRMFLDPSLQNITSASFEIGASSGSANNWITIFEAFTKGDPGWFINADGNYSSKVSLGITKGTGSGAPLSWSLSANYLQPQSLYYNEMWPSQINTSIEPIFGEWFTLDILMNPGSGSSTPYGGLITVKLIDDDYNEQTLFNYRNTVTYPNREDLYIELLQPGKLSLSEDVINYLSSNSSTGSIYINDFQWYNYDGYLDFVPTQSNPNPSLGSDLGDYAGVLKGIIPVPTPNLVPKLIFTASFDNTILQNQGSYYNFTWSDQLNGIYFIKNNYLEAPVPEYLLLDITSSLDGNEYRNALYSQIIVSDSTEFSKNSGFQWQVSLKEDLDILHFSWRMFLSPDIKVLERYNEGITFLNIFEIWNESGFNSGNGKGSIRWNLAIEKETGYQNSLYWVWSGEYTQPEEENGNELFPPIKVKNKTIPFGRWFNIEVYFNRDGKTIILIDNDPIINNTLLNKYPSQDGLYPGRYSDAYISDAFINIFKLNSDNKIIDFIKSVDIQTSDTEFTGGKMYAYWNDFRWYDHSEYEQYVPPTTGEGTSNPTPTGDSNIQKYNLSPAPNLTPVIYWAGDFENAVFDRTKFRSGDFFDIENNKILTYWFNRTFEGATLIRKPDANSPDDIRTKVSYIPEWESDINLIPWVSSQEAILSEGNIPHDIRIATFQGREALVSTLKSRDGVNAPRFQLAFFTQDPNNSPPDIIHQKTKVWIHPDYANLSQYNGGGSISWVNIWESWFERFQGTEWRISIYINNNTTNNQNGKLEFNWSTTIRDSSGNWVNRHTPQFTGKTIPFGRWFDFEVIINMKTNRNILKIDGEVQLDFIGNNQFINNPPGDMTYLQAIKHYVGPNVMDWMNSRGYEMTIGWAEWQTIKTPISVPLTTTSYLINRTFEGVTLGTSPRTSNELAFLQLWDDIKAIPWAQYHNVAIVNGTIPNVAETQFFQGKWAFVTTLNSVRTTSTRVQSEIVVRQSAEPDIFHSKFNIWIHPDYKNLENYPGTVSYVDIWEAWHADGDNRTSIYLDKHPTTGLLSFKMRQDEDSNYTRRSPDQFSSKPVPTGQWFEMEVIWQRSTNRNRVLIDGETVIDYIGVNNLSSPIAFYQPLKHYAGVRVLDWMKDRGYEMTIAYHDYKIINPSNSPIESLDDSIIVTQAFSLGADEDKIPLSLETTRDGSPIDNGRKAFYVQYLDTNIEQGLDSRFNWSVLLGTKLEIIHFKYRIFLSPDIEYLNNWTERSINWFSLFELWNEQDPSMSQTNNNGSARWYLGFNKDSNGLLYWTWNSEYMQPNDKINDVLFPAQKNYNAKIPFGRWFTLEIYFNRNGRTVVITEDQINGRQLIFDFIGQNKYPGRTNLYPGFNKPWNFFKLHTNDAVIDWLRDRGKYIWAYYNDALWYDHREYVEITPSQTLLGQTQFTTFNIGLENTTEVVNVITGSSPPGSLIFWGTFDNVTSVSPLSTFNGWNQFKSLSYIDNLYFNTQDGSPYVEASILVNADSNRNVLYGASVSDGPSSATSSFQLTIGLDENLPAIRSSHRMYLSPDFNELTQYPGSISLMTLFEIWNQRDASMDGNSDGSARWTLGLYKDEGVSSPLSWMIKGEYLQPSSKEYSPLFAPIKIVPTQELSLQYYLDRNWDGVTIGNNNRGEPSFLEWQNDLRTVPGFNFQRIEKTDGTTNTYSIDGDEFVANISSVGPDTSTRIQYSFDMNDQSTSDVFHTYAEMYFDPSMAALEKYSNTNINWINIWELWNTDAPNGDRTRWNINLKKKTAGSGTPVYFEVRCRIAINGTWSALYPYQQSIDPVPFGRWFSMEVYWNKKTNEFKLWIDGKQQVNFIGVLSHPGYPNLRPTWFTPIKFYMSNEIYNFMKNNGATNIELRYRRFRWITPNDSSTGGITAYKPVLIGKWFTLDYYFKRGEGTDGNIIVEIIPDDQSIPPYTLFDIKVPTQYPGKPNLFINQWQPFKIFTSPEILSWIQSRGKKLSAQYNDFKWYSSNVQAPEVPQLEQNSCLKFWGTFDTATPSIGPQGYTNWNEWDDFRNFQGIDKIVFGLGNASNITWTAVDGADNGRRAAFAEIINDNDQGENGMERAQMQIFFSEFYPNAEHNTKGVHFSHRMYLSPDIKLLEYYPSSIRWFIISELKLQKIRGATGDSAGAARWHLSLWKDSDTVQSQNGLASGNKKLYWHFDGETMQPKEVQYDPFDGWPNAGYSNKEVEIPFGEWFTLEIYTEKGFQDEGRWYITMTKDSDGIKHVLFDFRNTALLYPGKPELLLGNWAPFKLYVSYDVLDFIRSFDQNYPEVLTNPGDDEEISGLTQPIYAGQKRLYAYFNDFKWYSLTDCDGQAIIDGEIPSGSIITPPVVPDEYPTTNTSSLPPPGSGSNVVTVPQYYTSYTLTYTPTFNVIDINMNPTLNNVLENRRSTTRFDADYNYNQINPSNFYNITESIKYIGSYGYSEFINQFSVNNLAELQDSNYSMYSFYTSRYYGSQLSGKIINEFNVGDVSFGKEPVINQNQINFAYQTTIYPSNLALPSRSYIEIKYLIDEEENVLDLTKNNNNIFEVQNTFKQGTIANISLFQYTNTYIEQLNKDVVIFDSGFRFMPTIHNVFSSSTDLAYSFFPPIREEIQIPVPQYEVPPLNKYSVSIVQQGGIPGPSICNCKNYLVTFSYPGATSIDVLYTRCDTNTSGIRTIPVNQQTSVCSCTPPTVRPGQFIPGVTPPQVFGNSNIVVIEGTESSCPDTSLSSISIPIYRTYSTAGGQIYQERVDVSATSTICSVNDPWVRVGSIRLFQPLGGLNGSDTITYIGYDAASNTWKSNTILSVNNLTIPNVLLDTVTVSTNQSAPTTVNEVAGTVQLLSNIAGLLATINQGQDQTTCPNPDPINSDDFITRIQYRSGSTFSPCLKIPYEAGPYYRRKIEIPTVLYNDLKSGYKPIFSSSSDSTWTSSMFPASNTIIQFNIGDRLHMPVTSSGYLAYDRVGEFEIIDIVESGSGVNRTSYLVLSHAIPDDVIPFTFNGSTLSTADERTCMYIYLRRIPDETNIIIEYNNPLDSNENYEGIIYPKYIRESIRRIAGNIIKSLRSQQLI